MFAELSIILAAITLTYGQLIPSQNLQIIPVSTAPAVYGLGTQPLNGGRILIGTPATANVQLVRQQIPQIQYIAAGHPQFVSAPQPRYQIVSGTPSAISVARPQPISTPQPIPIRLTSPVVEENYEEPGTPVAPYQFGFDETDEFGMNLKRHEVSENGVVTGQYSFTTPEGYTRIVDYVSDENGFRAQVQTNEPGTTNSQPAGAAYFSSAQTSPQRR